MGKISFFCEFFNKGSFNQRPFKSILSSSVIKNFEGKKEEEEDVAARSSSSSRGEGRLDFSHVIISMDFEWMRRPGQTRGRGTAEQPSS